MGPEHLEMPRKGAVPQLRVTRCKGTLCAAEGWPHLCVSIQPGGRGVSEEMGQLAQSWVPACFPNTAWLFFGIQYPPCSGWVQHTHLSPVAVGTKRLLCSVVKSVV